VIKNRWIGNKKTCISQIMNEIQIMQKLSHPHILPLYEIIDDDNSNKLYISQECMNRGCLSDIIPINERTAQLYFAQILSAIDYLHNTVNLVHRDLKLENFLLNDKEKVKICGFSSAEPADAAQGISGTYAYLPPETYKGQIYAKEADVWALGVSLYYMVEGKAPISNNKDKNAEVEIPENLSNELKALLLKIFEKNPESRIKVQDIFKTEWMAKVYS
jgi:serine/threonine protein kinase